MLWAIIASQSPSETRLEIGSWKLALSVLRHWPSANHRGTRVTACGYESKIQNYKSQRTVDRMIIGGIHGTGFHSWRGSFTIRWVSTRPGPLALHSRRCTT